MSDWNWSGERLRSWTPRHPSPELRARVFGPAAQGPRAAQALGDWSRWLVPAFGCFLLVAGSLSERMPEHLLGGETNWLAAGSAGSSRIMMAEVRQHSEKNAIPAKHMEYRLGGTLFEPRPAVFSHTNHLIQQ